jgi:hypothetical protein
MNPIESLDKEVEFHRRQYGKALSDLQGAISREIRKPRAAFCSETTEIESFCARVIQTNNQLKAVLELKKRVDLYGLPEL